MPEGHVGFTGTSKRHMTIRQAAGVTEELVRLWDEGYRWAHHGDCVKADEDFHTIAQKLGYNIVVHPPRNPVKRAFCVGYAEIREEKDYLDRNRDMVQEIVRLIATPFGEVEEIRSGTWATVRYARKRKVPVVIVNP